MNTPTLGLGSWLERESGSVPGASITSSSSSKASEPQHDTDAAIDFLIDLDPEGRHDLAALDPNTPGKPDCATFLPAEHKKMRRWIEARQGKLNLYSSVN